MFYINQNLFNSIYLSRAASPKYYGLYSKLLGERAIDVLLHLPVDMRERFLVQTLGHHHLSRLITIQTTIEEVPMKNARYRSSKSIVRIVTLTEGGQRIDLVFFNSRFSYFANRLKVGQKVIISGKLEQDSSKYRSGDGWQISHPDHIGGVETLQNWVGPEYTYPLTTGLSRAMVVKVIHKTLEQFLPMVKDLPEWISKDLIEKYSWPTWAEALQQVHTPKPQPPASVVSRDGAEVTSITKNSPLKLTNPARQRLVFDEMLAHQLKMQLTRREVLKMPAHPLPLKGNLINRLTESLPFKLTPCQTQAFHEISQDLRKNEQTLRLLQGDVGSGKTVVALLSCLQAIEAGYQAALLVPTDILARQHYHSITKMSESLGIRVELLTAREKGKKRTQMMGDLKSEDKAKRIDLLVGTHAVIENYVEFHKLGLVVIDEQHRFGVKQRLALSQKGMNPHVLNMTATPIPRTLLLANYGDMDVSNLRQKPPGRKPIVTKTIPMARMAEVVEAIRRKITDGQKIYWVCPLVEESEALDLTAAVERFNTLNENFPGLVSLVHGKLKSKDKEEAMAAFTDGDAQILVATTVIEVGIDVPTATVMIIENAERFGLSQLHQLRGRVGRGSDVSVCILLYNNETASKTARKRLAAIRDSDDGFKIAEEDLKLRGGGEVLGLRQSGAPKFRLFSLDDEDDDESENSEAGDGGWPANSEILNQLFIEANKHAKRILSALAAPDSRIISSVNAGAVMGSATGGGEDDLESALEFLLTTFNHHEALTYRRG